MRTLLACLLCLLAVPAYADITSNLTLYYTFNDGTGTTATDSASPAHNGTLSNGAAFGTGYLTGGVVFNGISSRVTSTTGNNLFTSGATGTIAMWYKPIGTGFVTDFYFHGPGLVYVNQYYGFYRASVSGQDRIWFHNYDGNSDSVGVTYTPGQWVHLVWVHSGGTLYAYKNGVLAGSVASGTTEDITGTILLGYNSDQLHSDSGTMDELRFYDRALSADDVLELYQYTTTISGQRIVGNRTVQGAFNAGVDTGAVNAMAVNLSKPLTAYVDRSCYTVKVGSTNTGPTTINFNGVGDVDVQKNGQALTGGELIGGTLISLCYDLGTQAMQLMTPPGNIPRATVFNVKDYGAVGDGVTLDTTAILATVAAAPDGSTIYFPPGTYMSNMQAGTWVDSRNNLTFTGDGPGSIIKLYNPAGTTALYPLYITASSGITIRNLAFDMNHCLNYCGVSVNQSPYFLFENNTVYDSNINTTNNNDKFGLTYQSLGEDMTTFILNNTFIDTQIETDRITNVLISGNKVIRPRFTAGIGTFTNANGYKTKQLTIVDNVIIDADVSCAGICVILDPSTTINHEYGDIIIANNTIIYNSTDCIHITCAGIGIGQGNSSTSNTGNSFHGFRITGNYIWFNPALAGPHSGVFPYRVGQGINLNAGPTQDYTFYGFTIAYNQIYLNDDPATGFSLRKVEGATITGNQVYNLTNAGSGGMGIIRMKDSVISHNKFYGSAGPVAITFDVNNSFDQNNHSFGNEFFGGITPWALSGSGYPANGTLIEDIPATDGLILSLTAASDQILAPFRTVRISGTGVYTLSHTPTIVAGRDGQRLTLINTGANTLTLQDESAAAGTKLRLCSGTTLALAQYKSAEFVYVTAALTWTQICGGAAGGSGTVTSVATGFGLTGGTITTTGTVSHVAPSAADQVYVSDSTSAATWRTLPDCTDTDGKHINYTQSTNLFSCGTSSSGGAGTPGGSDTQLQYNNSTAFGGVSGVLTDGTGLTKLTEKCTTVTTNTSLGTHLCVAVDTSGGDVTITVPAPTSATQSQRYHVFKSTSDTGKLTLHPSSATLLGVSSDLACASIYCGYDLSSISSTDWLVDVYSSFSGFNAQTDTYTVLATDASKLITLSKATAFTVTLPDATVAGFGIGTQFVFKNIGVGPVTIARQTASTIDGATSIVLLQNNSAVLISDGTNYISRPSVTRSSQQLSFHSGHLAAVSNAKGAFAKIEWTGVVDNIVVSAIEFTCSVDPAVTLYECGTDATCASPTTIGSATITAASTAVTGTVSNSQVTAGDYIAWAISAGTCTALNIAGTAQLHN